MSSINSVNSYWNGSAKPSTPQKAGSNAASSNVDPLTLYWGRPGATGTTTAPQKAGSNAASFKIQEGNLDVQATSFIQKWDANKDGVLDLSEFKQSDGLTGAVKTSIASADLAAALWATIAGPDGTMSAAEYARSLLGMDENLDGVITQAESDKIKTKWAKDSLADPGKANVRIYNELVALGTDVGLDKKFKLGYEEAYAKSLEASWSEEKDASEDDYWDSASKGTASLASKATDLSDISGLLVGLCIEMPKTTTSAPTTTTTSTSSIDPATLALLNSLGIDTSTLSTSTTPSTTTTSTAGSDANFGFSAAVLATLHPPKNVLDGLPIA